MKKVIEKDHKNIFDYGIIFRTSDIETLKYIFKINPLCLKNKNINKYLFDLNSKYGHIFMKITEPCKHSDNVFYVSKKQIRKNNIDKEKFKLILNRLNP